MSARRPRRGLELVGDSLRLAGCVGFVSPWLPDSGDHRVSDDLAGWALLAWLAMCAAMIAVGVAMTRRWGP